MLSQIEIEFFFKNPRLVFLDKVEIRQNCNFTTIKYIVRKIAPKM